MQVTNDLTARVTGYFLQCIHYTIFMFEFSSISLTPHSETITSKFALPLSNSGSRVLLK